MQCPKCNSSNDSDALFCSECGNAIAGGQKGPSAKAWRSYGYALLLLPVIVLAVAVGYYKFFLPRGIAALVNGEEIKVSDLDAEVTRFKTFYGPSRFEGGQAEQQRRRLRYDVLNRMITETLILQEARKAGVSVTRQDIADGVEQRRQSSGMDKDGFGKAVISRYGDVSSYEEAIRRELTIRKFIAETKGPHDAGSGKGIDDWIQKLYSKAAIRITLSEQLSGAACGCCGSDSRPQKAATCSRSAMKSPSSDTQRATEAALKYWHEKNGPENVSAKVTDYGCHMQIDIIRDGKLAGSLRYQEGRISE